MAPLALRCVWPTPAQMHRHNAAVRLINHYLMQHVSLEQLAHMLVLAWPCVLNSAAVLGALMPIVGGHADVSRQSQADPTAHAAGSGTPACALPGSGQHSPSAPPRSPALQP